MASQESGVLQRLLGFLDYGNEFVHFFVMGGFLKAQDMSRQARDKGAYSTVPYIKCRGQAGGGPNKG
jgi:hypothetical protein